jgi:p-aminobenzoyl-glutamate transporter AbgT
MAKKSSSPDKRSPLGDTIFAIVHLLLLIAILVYGLVSLVLGNSRRFVVIMGCLVLYYFLVLHKPVFKEIERRRSLKSAAHKGPLKK